MLTQFTLDLFKPHIICFGMVLLSIHSMCCGLVERKVILHQALLSECLVDVYPIYLSFFYKPHIICFGCSKRTFH